MALLADYKLTAEDFKKYNFNPEDIVGQGNVPALIEEMWEKLLTFLYGENNDIDEDDDIVLLLDNASKIAGFKFAQYLICKYACTITDNPITEEVVKCLKDRCKLRLWNGWQR